MISINRANIDKLIHLLESLQPWQFKMSIWFAGIPGKELHDCGSVGCIGGWAETLAVQENPDHRTTVDDDNARWFGMSTMAYEILTHPDDYDNTALYSRTRCIHVLKHLRDNGVVDWDRFPAENYNPDTN